MGCAPTSGDWLTRGRRRSQVALIDLRTILGLGKDSSGIEQAWGRHRLGMGSAYNPAAWTGFFSAEVGASAALAGLIFVAVSINLAQIVKQRQLVSRSAKALLSLMAVLFSSSLCLIPDLSRVILGYELT